MNTGITWAILNLLGTAPLQKERQSKCISRCLYLYYYYIIFIFIFFIIIIIFIFFIFISIYFFFLVSDQLCQREGSHVVLCIEANTMPAFVRLHEG